MLFKGLVHSVREEELDGRLGLIDSSGIHILLSFVLNVSLDTLLDLIDVFHGQVCKQIDRFLLPTHTRVSLKEV